ncbi:hypothetical protein [Zoogloea sp. LCSB751]|uniref:hypothetical protein n=1 Tax=Zoogloea sp. LCSB751 TaxID=1965277 RepID=UPI0009A55283|nr:hypothetical protein [Zoogloea sp. LCSB751]
MDIRAVGQPITASQRHSYAETPDSSFYQTFQSAFAAAKVVADGGATGPQAAAGQAGPTSSEALEAILGRTHAELSALRDVGADSQAVYAGVLNKAYGSGAMGNARQFLGSLSAEELEAVRRNHCLAEPINVAAISEEGARNLLLPEGFSVDLNGDGFEEVGAALTAHFPPDDAPAAVREAWFQATAAMPDGDAMTYGLMMHDAVYGLRIDGHNTPSPYKADDMDSYRQIVSNFLAALEAQRGFISSEQYARDKDFFTRLGALLAQGSSGA